MNRSSLAVLLLATVTACSRPDPAADAATEAFAIADEYVAEYYEQFPHEAYETGYAAPLDRMGDFSPESMAAWRALEDEWLGRLEAIDPAELAGTEAFVPYQFSRERLEASIAARVCETHLWNVAPNSRGWQNFIGGVFAKQPVGTQEARAATIARARDMVRFIDTEIENLRLGAREGFTAPRSNVPVVISQVEGHLSVSAEESPIFEPALRDGDPAFIAELAGVIADEVFPAIERYRDFLRDEYLAAAREAIGVTANPGGHECYLASVQYHATLPLTPEEIHETGLREIERIHSEMQEIGRRSFGTEDVQQLLALVKADPANAFDTRDEIIVFAENAVERAKAAMPDWFGFVPEAEVELRPYPEFMQRTGGGFYSAGAADGSTPGTYEFGIHDPGDLNRAGGFEATTFHETYPGHHMQVYVAIEGAGVHPVLKYFYTSGLGEGWALYSERLADEAGLYTADVDRLGMLSNEAFRAARLVVDPGIHVLGWTRQQAEDYMLANTAESRGGVESEISRYIAWPGQATSYLTGSLLIQELRRKAEAALGDGFDMRRFHDLVIEDGTITLTMLEAKINAWIEGGGG
jgi:uncharacterized protein (DUF885 family)